MPRTIVMVSVDTEEDNWVATRDGVTVENVRELPKLHRVLEDYGAPVTYFTSHAVASAPWAATLLSGLERDGRAEIAAQLHSWNTPPLDEPMVPRNTMLLNLPADLQRAKVDRLTETISAIRGRRPTAFRAGRFGLGADTIKALLAAGYQTDSSVTPWITWQDTDEGANFVGAPLRAYRTDGTVDVRWPTRDGIVEVPLSCGYTRWPFDKWHTTWEMLQSVGSAGIASRLAVVRPVTLSPETNPLPDLIQLARLLVEHDVPHLSLFWHSPTLVPGLTPFVHSAADVERLYAAVTGFLDALPSFTTPVFMTVSDAARELAPAVPEGPGAA
jgi:hypothetical protein